MAQLDKLIPVINKLQDVFAEMNMDLTKIDLPQIAVVGAQSSGKSSVLENIVGRDFLPRGSGIVTRRPLVLQLTHTDSGEPYGEFLHKPGEKFFDFDAIRREIENVTEAEVGRGKGVSNVPINLKIFATDVVNLTLIDLPGITKVAVQGQDENIPAMIKAMVLMYIKKPSCIILAVSAANQDLANSDALKLAREVDPSGDRTVGVLTKIDLMDKGTDCLDVLDGKVVPLKKGYIGVINRSQQDIEDKKDIRVALGHETEFFENHPKYKPYVHRLGTPVLARTLNTILLHHIRNTLPRLKQMISDMVAKTQKMLRDLGGDENELASGALLLNLLTKYATTVKQWIDGSAPEATSRTDLVGGARINRIFHNSLEDSLKRINPHSTLSEEHIRTIIDNAKGTRSALFLPEQAFEMLVRQQVRMLEDPCQNCCELVHNELVALCEACEKELVRFPELKVRVNTKVRSLLLSYMDVTKEFVRNLIMIENAYVNTRHPQFYGGGGQFIDQLLSREKLRQEGQQTPPPQLQAPPVQAQQAGPAGAQGAPRGPAAAQLAQQQQPQPQPQQQQQVQPRPSPTPPGHPDGAHPNNDVRMIREILIQYYQIVQISMQDKIPKTVMYFLVDRLVGNLQNELVREFYKEELFEVLLKESDDVAAKRKAARAMLSCCLRAQQVLADVQDYKV
jgi:GTPase SAR1 family protein